MGFVIKKIMISDNKKISFKYIALGLQICLPPLPQKKIYIYIYIYIYVGSQIVTHTLTETGNGPNRPNTIDL